MSNYDLGWHRQLQFKLATRRAKKEALRNALLIAGLVLCYGIVGTMDYADQQRQRLESEAAYAKALRECMSAGENNQVGGFYFPDSKRAYECKVQPL